MMIAFLYLHRSAFDLSFTVKMAVHVMNVKSEKGCCITKD